MQRFLAGSPAPKYYRSRPEGVVAELLRCKSCGYIVKAARVGDVCPACGVARKMMEPWKDPMSARRRFLLGLDLHPIADHFFVSFATCAVAAALIVLLFPGVFGRPAVEVLRVFVGVLPVAVVASYVSGLYDGTIRFRKTTTPVLQAKKVWGALFLPSLRSPQFLYLLWIALGFWCARESPSWSFADWDVHLF